MFTEKEIAYLNSQPLARIATVSTSGQPDNSATGFEFDGEVFYLGSLGDLRQSRRGKSVLAGNTNVALVVECSGHEGAVLDVDLVLQHHMAQPEVARRTLGKRVALALTS